MTGSRLLRPRHVSVLLAAAVGVGAPATMVNTAAAAPGSVAKSSTLAGYLVTKTKVHIRSVSATFKIPTITCKKNESGVGPAVIVENEPRTSAARLYSDSSAVAVACQNKTPVYESIISVNNVEYPNKYTDLAVGDKVVSTVTIGPRKTVVAFDDVTRKEAETESGRTRTMTNAWIGATSLAVTSSGSHRAIAIDPFTPIAVTHATVNGGSLASESPTRYNWVVGGTTLVSAGRITHGGNFTATFRHSN